MSKVIILGWGKSVKQAAAFAGERLRLFDVITHDGEGLVVLLWITNKRTGLRKPKWVLPLRSASHHVLDTVDPPYDFFLDDPLPESLILGTATHRERIRYGVRNGPDTAFPLSPGARPPKL